MNPNWNHKSSLIGRFHCGVFRYFGAFRRSKFREAEFLGSLDRVKCCSETTGFFQKEPIGARSRLFKIPGCSTNFRAYDAPDCLPSTLETKLRRLSSGEPTLANLLSSKKKRR